MPRGYSRAPKHAKPGGSHYLTLRGPTPNLRAICKRYMDDASQTCVALGLVHLNLGSRALTTDPETLEMRWTLGKTWAISFVRPHHRFPKQAVLKRPIRPVVDRRGEVCAAVSSRHTSTPRCQMLCCTPAGCRHGMLRFHPVYIRDSRSVAQRRGEVSPLDPRCLVWSSPRSLGLRFSPSPPCGYRAGSSR